MVTCNKKFYIQNKYNPYEKLNKFINIINNKVNRQIIMIIIIIIIILTIKLSVIDMLISMEVLFRNG